MKNFDDFKKHVNANGKEIHSAIHQSVLNAVDKQDFDDIGEEHEFYLHAWVEIGIMEILEHYHNWLNS